MAGFHGPAVAWLIRAARALLRGERFPPLILAGSESGDHVCLEGNHRLTAHAPDSPPVLSAWSVPRRPLDPGRSERRMAEVRAENVVKADHAHGTGQCYTPPSGVSLAGHLCWRSTNFWVLPVDVFGSGPNSIESGHL